MIINLKRTIIRIVLIIIIILVLCQLGIYIRKNYKLLKFYDYKTKKLKIDKLNELNNIDNLKKQLIQNESKYNISKNKLKYSINNYNKTRKNCKNQKERFILKVNTLTDNVNKKIFNKFDLWDENDKFKGGQNDNKCAFSALSG